MLQQSTDQTDERGRERLEYGTREFPAAFFYDDLDVVTVPWHWHEEFELAYMVRGSLRVRAGGASFDVSAGDAYFVNASVMHSAEPLYRGAIQKACVFNARLIASEDSAIYQRYVLLPMARDDSHPSAGRGEKDAIRSHRARLGRGRAQRQAPRGHGPATTRTSSCTCWRAPPRRWWRTPPSGRIARSSA